MQPSLTRQHTVNPSLCAVTQFTAVITLKTAHVQPITLWCYPVYCSHHSQDSTRSTNHSLLLNSVLQPSISRQRRSTHHNLCFFPVYCSHHTQHSTRSTYHTLCCCPVYCCNHSQDSTQSTYHTVLLPSGLQLSLSRQHTVNPSLCAVTQFTAIITLKTAHSQPITLCCYHVNCNHHSQDSKQSTNHSVLLPSVL